MSLVTPFARRILVPRDFSATSEMALDWALDLAARADAELHQLHVDVVYANPFTGHVGELAGPPPAAIAERLRTRDDGSELEAAFEVESVVLRDVAPAPAIAQYAEEQRIDLLILGTHGRRGVRRFLLGSVTEEVLRLAPCAVLAVRDTDVPSASRPVVVGVDFSASSERALVIADSMAGLYRAPLHVIHILPIAPYPALYGEDALARNLPSRFAEQTIDRLRELMDRLSLPHRPTTEFRVEAGQAWREITEHAERARAGLVVVGSGGMSSIATVLLGSVAERVLRTAPCSVLVTRHSEDDGPHAPPSSG